MKKTLASIVLIFLTSSAVANGWSLEIGTGYPYNVVTPLTISQEFHPDINLHAHYETKPFSSPFYHDIRIGKWCDGWAWEFEDIHHKIYLKNRNDEVSQFSISHGYNLLYVNRAVNWHGLIWRLGAGLVVAHPESTIRGLKLSETGGTFNNGGYFIAGASFQGGLSKRFYIRHKFFFEIESKVTASQACVRVVNGEADAPNIAFHLNFGIGYDFLNC